MEESKKFITSIEEEPEKSQLEKINMPRLYKQMLLDQISIEGQSRLGEAKVLVIGAGGVGSSALFYLVAAGIRTIGIVDGDFIDLSNLNRQILHTSARIGENKASSAQQTLLQFTPDPTIKTYPFFLSKENAEEIISSYDIVLDASDNPSTRYLVNDAAILQKVIHLLLS